MKELSVRGPVNEVSAGASHESVEPIALNSNITASTSPATSIGGPIAGSIVGGLAAGILISKVFKK